MKITRNSGTLVAATSAVVLLCVGALFLMAMVKAANMGKQLSSTVRAKRNAAREDLKCWNASHLSNLYIENGIRADMEFEGKTIEVLGSVRAVDVDFIGIPYVTLETGNVFGVQCKFYDKRQLKELAVGDTVRIRGRCAGSGALARGHVVIERCGVREHVSLANSRGLE